MPRCVILLAWIFLVYACREDIRLPEHPAIYDLATPIRLSGDTARVYLTDYFLEPAKIKKITSSEDLKLVWKKGRNEILLLPEISAKPMGNIRVKTEGYTYDIPVLKSMGNDHTGKAPVIFTDRIKGDTICLLNRNPVEEWRCM
ncbi:hypothetical protein [Culturomica massiliensis]|uniref:hypothetical protein n=1 Tax=Culturomica massiliensis TaxID=1841857 RepID=UPI002665FEE2|nr:hypothetical protein [Culturomica massiliensis]